MKTDIWIWVHHRDGAIEETTLGLVAEAGRLARDVVGGAGITALAIGNDLDDPLKGLGAYGVDRVLVCKGPAVSRYHGELYAGILASLMADHAPHFFLMAHNDETADLAPRLAALRQAGVVTRALDLRVDEQAAPVAVRPVANGFLFEAVRFQGPAPFIVTFLPSVLNIPDPGEDRPARVTPIDLPAQTLENLRTEIVDVIAAAPGELDIEAADVVVAGGRGVGRDEKFDIIHQLAEALGASVAGTRPVIDWQSLPFECQVGQTGKTIAPKLLVNCGISGANEYTAGMEKSQAVIAIDVDPQARIFRFADLGLVGDVHDILPLLIERLNALGKTD